MCELSNGDTWIYDVCDEKDTLNPIYNNVLSDLEYIGRGTVLSLFGKIERSVNPKQYHFWRFKTKFIIKIPQ